MKTIPPLRTRRISAVLRELSIGDSLTVAGMHQAEATSTAFLRAAVAEVKSGPADPRDWTVQERMLAVCTYLAAVADDGPDFSVGAGRFSDYVDGEHDIPFPVAAIGIGEVGGDAWQIRHLTGGMAESIERMEGEVAGLSGRLHWLFGAMAAQLVLDGQGAPSPEDSEGAFDEHLVKQMQVLMGYPETSFSQLMAVYHKGRQSLHHLFEFDFSEEGGIVALQKQKEGEVEFLPPARFPCDSCLSAVARGLGGKP